jgi:hypothetical protein
MMQAGAEMESPRKDSGSKSSGAHVHNFSTDIELQREALRRKPALRLLYSHWYAQCVQAFSQYRPTVEIGCGAGNFKAFYSAMIATDVLQGTGADLVADATALPIGVPGEPGSSGAAAADAAQRQVPAGEQLDLGGHSKSQRAIFP